MMGVAYLVLALSLVPTAVVYYRVRANVETHAKVRFERAAASKQAAIEQKVPGCVEELLGFRGLFAANPSVSLDQWQKYTASVQIPRLYPGIRVLGYLERVDADRKQTFVKRVAPEAGIEVRILPEGDRPVYFPLTYASNFDPGLRGDIGRDDFANPEYRQFMEMARDSGEPMATGKIVFTGEDSAQKTEGFVVYVPVYHSGAPATTVEERRAALQGFVFGVIDSNKLLGGQDEPIDAIIDYQIFDGTETTPGHLLHDHGGIARTGGVRSNQLNQKTTMTVLNRFWTVQFSSLPLFDAESSRNLPLVSLVSWLTLSLLLFGITWGEVKARTRAEQSNADLQESEAALEVEKEQLAVTLYSIGDGVITTGIDGCVVSINKKGEQLTGWPQAEALGKPLPELFKILQDNTRELLPSPVESVMRTGADSGVERAAILIGRDGTERPIANSAAPIRNREGGIIGVVVVFRDVTERQKTEAELLKESKLESVGLLAGGIAHDFNNILQGILGNLSLARMNAHSTEKMLERLAGVEKSAMRAKDLTQQLVMFARGGAPIRRQLQLTNTIRDATLFALHGTNVHCEFSLPADIWPVEVDEGQFRQVINNIVINAVQAMPEGGKIEVRSENVEFTAGFLPPLKAGRYVKVSVRDYGTGIRAEHLSRIFDPYFTTRGHARGLGLASAYSVVRKHDGQISVDTQTGRGSTFQIYLPASLKVVVAPAADADQKQFFGQGRILVMDDEADILMLAGEMLKSMGYEVETAKEGGEALERYMAVKGTDNAFTVVITDLTVPEGMGGKECMRRLKVLDPNVKAIVSSGYSLDPVMANFREFGFSGVIPKPYVIEELARVLEEVVGNKSGAAAG
jgi:PAS domain S-box-containing protein